MHSNKYKHAGVCLVVREMAWENFEKANPFLNCKIYHVNGRVLIMLNVNITLTFDDLD